MSTTKPEEEINRILNNDFKKKHLVHGYLSKEQLETLKRFTEYYSHMPSSRGGKIKLTSVRNSLTSLRKLGLFLKKPFEEATQQDLISFYTTHLKGSLTTMARSKVTVRYFYKWLGQEEKIIDPRLKPETVISEKKPSDLLTTEEVQRMLEFAGSYRNKVLIMLSFAEGGLRAGEIASLTRDSVEFDSNGMKVFINVSKTKRRYERFIDAEPFMRNYLNTEYSAKGDDASKMPLFFGDRAFKHRPISRDAIGQLFKRIGKKAGINKRIYTHLGRHNAITRCHKLGMDVDTIALRCGITPSTVRRVYLHLDDTDADNAYLKAVGGLKEDKKEEIEREVKAHKPKKCPRCQVVNPSTHKYCNCGMCLDEKELIKLTQKEELLEKVMEYFKKNTSLS